MPHFLIIANGTFLSRDIIAEAAIGRTIIAVDGAADKLIPMNITPDIVLGDFDSVERIHDHKVPVIHIEDQQTTDLVKAIRYCDANDAESISIVCATGGRMDHHEAAMRALRTEYKPERVILMHTEMQTLRFAKDETVVFEGEIGDKCGVFAYPKGKFSSSGLEYDVKNFELDFGYSESSCNVMRETRAVVAVVGEALLVMPGLLVGQRK